MTSALTGDIRTGRPSFTVKRRLGVASAVSFIISSMCGSGIFISPTGVYRGAESVGLCLIIWVVCGFIALAGALVYAELGVLIPKSGGDYIYYRQTFGNFPAFWYIWSQCLVIYPVSQVIKSLTIAEYVAGILFDNCGPPVAFTHTIATTLIVTFTIINISSVHLVARTQIIFAIIKIASLSVIAGGGVYALTVGQFGSLDQGFVGTSTQVTGIVSAMYSGIWAFSGWKTLNFSIEEMKNPARILPLSVLISVLSVLVIYLLVNISYFVVLSPEEFMSSWAVGVTWSYKVFGKGGIFIPVVVACSVFGSACEASFTSSRIIFAGGRDGNFMELFSFINVNSRIPTPSILLISLLSLCYLYLPLRLGEIINMTGFMTAGFNVLTMICHIKLHFTMKDAAVLLKVPVVLSFFLALVYLYLFIAPILDGMKKEFVFPVVFMAFGFLIYFPFVFMRLQLPGLDHFVKCLQLLLEVAPVEQRDEVYV